jgi:hypothetical protein
MKSSFVTSAAMPALTIAVLSLGIDSVAGQVSSEVSNTNSSNSVILRTPWGQPNLQGIWDLHSITRLERPDAFAEREFLTPEEASALEQRARFETTDEARQEDTDRDLGQAYNDFWWDRATSVVSTLRTSLIVDPRNGKVPPLTPDAQARAAVERSHRPLRATGGFEGGRGADSWLDRSLWERCITQGLPRISGRAYNSNLKIVQTPDHVALLHEQIHEVRIIPLDGRPQLDQGIRQYMGDSRGHWDGETLVVETTNFGDQTNYRGSTSGLRMEERFTRIDAETLLYRVTFDDPTTWTSPWTAEIPWKATEGPLFEYACHEGNHGMTGTLTGGRAEDYLDR